MKRALIILLLAIVTVLCLSAASAAESSNTISLFGSFSFTFFGVEYERRLGNFGLGADLGLFSIMDLMLPEAFFSMRLNGLFRYYFNVSPQFKPYINVAPGVMMMFLKVPEPALAVAVPVFNMHTSAGMEYTPGNFRLALEAGYEFYVVPASPAQYEVPGLLFMKLAAGYRF